VIDMTDIQGQIALVTGASRGLGKAFVAGLLDRGAAKVYAAARDPRAVEGTDPRVVPVRLDVTDPDSVAALAGQVDDLTMLVNNAGVFAAESLLTGNLDAIRREFETNFYGPVLVTRALAPIIVANGGGVLLNVHSVLSWLSSGNSYSATKAALWSATNSVRVELAARRVQVVGLHVGYIDTEMAAAVTGPKTPANVVVDRALDGVAAGELEVLVDDITRSVKAGLSADITALYPQLAA
jgi:NAD(P)-dependent dehydrogenase (short-subunit alcohol dehydrogenase family)